MIIPLILCGGMGKRLWPLSTEDNPKQFHHFISPVKNNLQYIIDRFGIGDNFKSPVISCNYKHIKLIQSSLDSDQWQNTNIMVEPMIKGTGPAICYISEYLSKIHNEEDFLLIIPSDIFIKESEEFIKKLQEIYSYDSQEIICFGVVPRNPNSNFGYIKLGEKLEANIYKAAHFIEKPDIETANFLMKQGSWLWNTGIFFGKIKTFKQEFNKYLPDFTTKSQIAINNLIKLDNKIFVQKEHYNSFPELSIDKAIIEKTNKLRMMKLHSEWYDLGNWDSLWHFNQPSFSKVTLIDSDNCYVNTKRNKAILLGLKNIVVIESGEKIFITTKEYSNKIKDSANLSDNILKKLKTSESWGGIKNLSIRKNHELKHLEILPGHTAEFKVVGEQNIHLVVMKGQATIFTGKKKTILAGGEIFQSLVVESYKISNKTVESLYILQAVNKDDTLPSLCPSIYQENNNLEKSLSF